MDQQQNQYFFIFLKIFMLFTHTSAGVPEDTTNTESTVSITTATKSTVNKNVTKATRQAKATKPTKPPKCASQKFTVIFSF
jgi:hypothetical protein